MSVLALDVGGANLKLAHSDGSACSSAFELWRNPDSLADELCALAADFAPWQQLLVTMTAELCDCYATKCEGVAHVLEAAQKLAAKKPVHVWTTRGQFVTPDVAIKEPLAAAASNWHALATYVAQAQVANRSLLIDVGSTTTDIIPLRHVRVAAQGLTDTDRLATGELLYIGAKRTPLMALGPQIFWRGKQHNVMAEFFATTNDVYVLLGKVPEQPDSADTTDGQPMTAEFAATRVLRMVGSDLNNATQAQAKELANAFADRVAERMTEAITKVCTDATPHRVIISGSGAFIARDAVHAEFASLPVDLLEKSIGSEASVAACAHALVKLWEAE